LPHRYGIDFAGPSPVPSSNSLGNEHADASKPLPGKKNSEENEKIFLENIFSLLNFTSFLINCLASNRADLTACLLLSVPNYF
jgi:hypothetical protein